MKKINAGVKISLLAVALLLPVKTIAQDVVMPPFKGFKLEEGSKTYTPDNLWDYINGGADSYNALGFEELQIFEYKKGKKISVKVEVYRHRNPVMGFGIYALERSPTYNFIDLGTQGYSGEGYTNFCKGSYYVKIYTYSKSSKALAAVEEIARLAESSLEGSTQMPAILDKFPAKGRKINEEMFISENVMGHSFLSDAFRTSYSLDGKEFYIYLFDGSDSDNISQMAVEYLKKQQLDTDNTAEGKSMFEDGYNGYVFMAWKQGLMVLVSGLDAEDLSIADSYISQIIN